MAKKIGGILRRVEDIQKLKGYSLYESGIEKIINKRQGPMLTQIFNIKEKDREYEVELATGAIVSCDGFDLIYQKEKLFLRGYIVPNETVLVDEYGIFYREHENIVYV